MTEAVEVTIDAKTRCPRNWEFPFNVLGSTGQMETQSLRSLSNSRTDGKTKWGLLVRDIYAPQGANSH